jgi:hypothetical protein
LEFNSNSSTHQKVDYHLEFDFDFDSNSSTHQKVDVHYALTGVVLYRPRRPLPRTGVFFVRQRVAGLDDAHVADLSDTGLLLQSVDGWNAYLLFYTCSDVVKKGVVHSRMSRSPCGPDLRRRRT